MLALGQGYFKNWGKAFFIALPQSQSTAAVSHPALGLSPCSHRHSCKIPAPPGASGMGSMAGGDGDGGSRAAECQSCFLGPPSPSTGAALVLCQEPGSREMSPALQLECHSATLWWFARSSTGNSSEHPEKPNPKTWGQGLCSAECWCGSSEQGWWILGILPLWLFASCFSSAFHWNQRLSSGGFYFLLSNLLWSQQRGISGEATWIQYSADCSFFHFFPKEK